MIGTHNYFIYLTTNKMITVLYTGITNNLVRRIWEHKKKIIKGFTAKYNVDKLVYFENYSDVEQAIKREKEIKHWSRKKKMALIQSFNPTWRDLFKDIVG